MGDLPYLDMLLIDVGYILVGGWWNRDLQGILRGPYTCKMVLHASIH